MRANASNLSGQRARSDAHLNNNFSHHNNNNSMNNANYNPVLTKEIKRLKKEKKKKLSKIDIGQPTNFIHVHHVGLEKAVGAVTNQVG